MRVVGVNGSKRGELELIVKKYIYVFDGMY